MEGVANATAVNILQYILSIKSVHCTPYTYTMLRVNYTSKKLGEFS